MFEVGDLVCLAKDQSMKFVIVGYTLMYGGMPTCVPYNVYLSKLEKYCSIYTVVTYTPQLDKVDVSYGYHGADFKLVKHKAFTEEEVSRFLIKARLMYPHIFDIYVEKEVFIEGIKQNYIEGKEQEIQAIAAISGTLEEMYNCGFFVSLKNHQIKMYFKNGKVWYFLKELYSRSEYIKEARYIENNIVEDYSISLYDVRCRYNLKKVKQPDLNSLRVICAFDNAF